MISRREFLQTLARLAPVLGGSGLILSEPALLRALPNHPGWDRFCRGQDR